jgi:hypothetical protein
MNLKKIIVFYLVMVIPLIGLVLLVKYHLINSQFFVLGLLTYGLIYHPIISGLRLIKLGVIKKAEFWKNFNPFWGRKYFWILFFGSKK